MTWCRPGYSVELARAWFEFCDRSRAENTAYDLGIFCSGSGRLLGSVGLNLINREHRVCNLGYWVRQDAQRRGIAARAAVAICRFGFMTLGLNRIEIVAAQDNLASRRVAESIGAQFEGICRNRLLLGGSPVAAALYALVPGDPMPAGLVKG
jgi:ribosomal-protein-serine acetyltransferase